MNPQPRYFFDYTKYRSQLLAIFFELFSIDKPDWETLRKLLAKHDKPEGGVFSKNELISGLTFLRQEYSTGKYDDIPEMAWANISQWLYDDGLMSKIQMKPIRTQSGVTPVTILTKPFPCPGMCIFCPNDTRMPKSYLSDEPGAQRAERNAFDPYLQTFSRLKALQNIGHEVDKVEIIVLGGTWSFYPEAYQIWFIKRAFQAVNDFGDLLYKEYDELLNKIGNEDYRATAKDTDIIRNVGELVKPEPFKGSASKTYNRIISAKLALEKDTEYTKSQCATWEELEAEHRRNEQARYKVSGLVIETRPDNIDEKEVIRIRRLGCTKTQIGFQSLNDEVLTKNHRGHDVAATRRAIKLLRLGGFKIHGHWMANLYGSDVQKDILDYQKMFTDLDFRPDELKVYPCSLLETAELMDYYEAGLWQPYTRDELLEVVTQVMASTPQYCRLTRIIRDIPSTDIVVGNKLTNFREVAEKELARTNQICQDIRSREIKKQRVTLDDLHLDIIEYESNFGQEYFLQYVTKGNLIAGFLRLALPLTANFVHPFIEELSYSGIIREIHVYGSVVQVGQKDEGKAQHLGLGKSLIEKASEIAKSKGFGKLAVISSVGTREYYRKRGFADGSLYQIKAI